MWGVLDCSSTLLLLVPRGWWGWGEGVGEGWGEGRSSGVGMRVTVIRDYGILRIS